MVLFPIISACTFYVYLSVSLSLKGYDFDLLLYFTIFGVAFVSFLLYILIPGQLEGGVHRQRRRTLLQQGLPSLHVNQHRL